ncbi:hypothetical protein ACHAPT_012977 [Fusarium lateritium]
MASVDAPIETLRPNIHWSKDTKCNDNVVPVPIKNGSVMYYGNNDPSKDGHFAWLTWYFTMPSVNLDHCDYLSVEFKDGEIIITFASSEAYELAVKTWSCDDGFALIAFLPGCGQDDDRCYFKVTTLRYPNGELVIIAEGGVHDPTDLISDGEAEWGWWTPKPPQPNPSTNPTTVPSAGPSTSPSSTPEDSDDGEYDEDFGYESECKPPVDTCYGLPTACLGDLFDWELDFGLGFSAPSDEQSSYVDDFGPDQENHALIKRNRVLEERDIVETFKNLGNTIKGWVDKAEEGFVALGKSIGVNKNLKKDIEWKLPDPDNKNKDFNKLADKNAKKTKSPWGDDSILIKSFGDKKGSDNDKVDNYMNVYCVGCGVNGKASLDGSVKWNLAEGFTEGTLEVKADIRAVIKIGVDAQLTAKETFTNSLFDVGLPGLSFGVLTIGPRISVESKVELESASKDSKKSTKSGWDPYFKPVFETEGDVMVSAKLGLPIGIKFGLKVATLDLSVGLVDEPSVKGVAQYSGSIKGDDKGFSGAFRETDGCEGIATQITWRNQLFVDVLKLARVDLHDTKDKPINRGCIKIPGKDKPSETNTAPTPSDTSSEEKPSEAGDAATPSEAPNGDGNSGEGNSEGNGESKVEKRQLRRQSDAEYEDVVDLTEFVTGSDTVDYELASSFPNHAYKDADGYEYTLLITHDATALFTTCGDGNIYGLLEDSPDIEFCAEMWANYNNTVVSDGADRWMYYYPETMEKLGVSRFRVDDTDELPEKAAFVAMEPIEFSEGGLFNNDYAYLAVDWNENIFYPITCAFKEGYAKMFLAKDIEKGIEMLKDPCLMHTVTGGEVIDCMITWLVQGEYEEGYEEYYDQDYSLPNDWWDWE